MRAVSSDDSALLRTIVAGTAAPSGDTFFTSLVGNLAAAIGMGYAVVAEVVDDARARSLAIHAPQGIESVIEWDLTVLPAAKRWTEIRASILPASGNSFPGINCSSSARSRAISASA